MRFNRSIFLSFLWSYLLLMGIVISIVSAVFISRFSAQKEELRNSYQNTLNVMTESISVQLDRCMVLLDEYVLDVHASALVNAAQATDVHTRENILALHRTLANNVSWQDICRQVTYLFGKMGLALSNTGSCEMENCYKLYFCNAFGSMLHGGMDPLDCVAANRHALRWSGRLGLYGHCAAAAGRRKPPVRGGAQAE